MEELKEIWKPINGYEGLYEISNYGRVKSLAREIVRGQGGVYKTKDIIRKPMFDHNGYIIVQLHKDTKKKTFFVHKLVWDHFGNKKKTNNKLHIDHIDNNILNNKIDNLQILTCRENTSKGYMRKKTLSKYTGVGFDKRRNKWCSQIYLNKKSIFLGYFNKEYDAHLAYQKALVMVDL